MQQTCVDDVLTRNYTDVNDTESLKDVTDVAVGELLRYKCSPFDCNSNGRCNNGTCVCKPGTTKLHLKSNFSGPKEKPILLLVLHA